METTGEIQTTTSGRGSGGGRPAGPQPDPGALAFWLVDRKTMKPEHAAPKTRADAFARLRSFVRHREPWDPWVARLFVLAAPPTVTQLTGVHRFPKPYRENPDPFLVSWELKGRRERLVGISASRIAREAGLSPSLLSLAENAGKVRADNLARIRAVLLRLERRRGLAPDPGGDE